MFVQLENLIEQKDKFLELINENDNVFPAVNINQTKFTKELIPHNCSEALLMTTTPGVSNLKFNEEVYTYIDSALQSNPLLKITVDGGVNSSNFNELKSKKLHSVVMGSYLSETEQFYNRFNSLNLKISKETLSSNISIHSKYLCHYKLKTSEESEVDLITIINIMDDFRSNYILIVSDDYDIKGIITDGDIKRHLLKNKKESIHDMKMKFNKNFYKFSNDLSIGEISQKLSLDLALGALPIEEDGKIRRAIHLKNI